MALGERSATQAWLIRTGEGGFALSACVEHGVVALRYHTVPDATSLSQGQIARHLADAKSRVALEAVAAMLVRFVHEVKLGDVVVTPHQASRLVYVGTVTGPYRFADPSPVGDLLHLRDVDWLGHFERDSLPTIELTELDRPPTLYSLPTAGWLDRARLLREAGSQVTAPPAGPRPKHAPRRRTVPFADCSLCGMPIPAGQLVSGRCGDCA